MRWDGHDNGHDQPHRARALQQYEQPSLLHLHEQRPGCRLELHLAGLGSGRRVLVRAVNDWADARGNRRYPEDSASAPASPQWFGIDTSKGVMTMTCPQPWGSDPHASHSDVMERSVENVPPLTNVMST